MSVRTEQLIRLGTQYGGWMIPANGLSSDSICYCAGTGEDLSFEIGLLNRYACTVYSFDPTPRAIAHAEAVVSGIRSGQAVAINDDPALCYELDDPSLIDRFHFEALGVYGEDATLKFYEPKDPSHVSHSVVNLQETSRYFEAECKSVPAIMAELDHDHIDLLKLDVEGAEFSVLENLLESGIRPPILCVELDEALQTPHRRRSLEAIDALIRAGFVPAFEQSWNVTFLYRPAWHFRRGLARLRLAARKRRAT